MLRPSLCFGLSTFFFASASYAADGPGIPNIAYGEERVGEILSIVDPGKAVSATALHRGYLFVPLGADHGGGQGTGGFAFYDVSDPANPTSIFDSRSDPATYHTPSRLDYVGDWAEIHHLPVSGDLMLLSERRNGSAGFSIFDAGPFYDDDPGTKPRTLSRFSFPGVTDPSNYDGFSFAPTWQGARYVYAPTGAQGLYIVDTTDPANPVLLRHMSRAALGNVTLRGAWVLGNLLILAEGNVQNTFQARIFDISNPANPVQTGSFDGPFGYHGFIYGSSFYGGGTPIARHDFTNPSNVVRTDLFANPGFDRPEYGYGKDGDLFIGHYPGATRWRLNGDRVDFVSRVNSGLIDDHAFLNPLGNLVLLCSDHNNDRKIMFGIHGGERDLSPPQALFTSPADGATRQHVLSRVGISFSDFVDPASVGGSTIIVRNFVTGEAVPGTFSTMMTLVNFVPDSPLEAGATYDVLLAAGGVKDQAGNAVPAEIRIARFSTGEDIENYTVAISSTEPVQTGETAAFSLEIDNRGGLDLEHSWDFGDGSAPSPFSPAVTASHLYQVPGNHTVTVRTRIAGQTYAPAVNGVQVVHRPIPAAKPLNHSTIVADPVHGLVWNVNPDNGSITAIDTESLLKLHEIPVGIRPVSLAIAPAGALWVVDKTGAALVVVDRATAQITATHPLPPGSDPHAIVIDADAAVAYLSLEALGKIVKLDIATGSLLDEVAVGPWPRGLSLDPVRQTLWVSRFISTDHGGELVPVDLAAFSASAPVPLAPVLEADSLSNGRGIPNYLAALTISPDFTQGFVPSKKDNIFRGSRRDGLPLTFEHSVRSMAARIDLETAAEMPGGALDFDNSDFATAAVFSPYGNLVFFSTSGSAVVWVVDAYDPRNSYTFDSGGQAPDGMVLSPDGSRLFIHNFMDRSVAVFRSAAACGGACGTAPRLAKISTVANERLSPQVLLGKQLFYNTSDPRLAQEGYMSCSSCHLDGGHDGRVWDFSSRGEGFRNTIDLNGRGIGHGPAHWSGNFDETQDFEGQIRTFTGGSGLVPDDLYHRGTRSSPLGESLAGLSEELDALAAYVRSLTAAGRSPHRNEDGSLTSGALIGRQIFIEERCASCHTGPAFTDSESMIRHHVGTLTEASGQRLGGELDGLDTPTLRGLWKSAPYLHDGSAASLRDVFLDRDLSGLHAGLFHRTEKEIDLLVAYLNSIDDLEPSAPGSGGEIPSLPSPPDREDPVHRSVSVPLSSPGGGTWQAMALPPGIEIDSLTGVLSGVPSTVGTFRALASFRGEDGRSALVEFNWTVFDPSAYRFVKFTSLSSHNGQPFSAMAEFNLLDEAGSALDRRWWSVTASTEETSSEFAPATNVIDGLASSFWHSQWGGASPAHPHELVFDLGAPLAFRSFTVLTRQDGHTNGRIRGYRLQASNDGVNWSSPLATGNLEDSLSLQTITLAGSTNRPPAFASGTALAVTENSPAGTLVGQVNATDPNPGQTVTYSLGAGHADGAFTIDPSTGQIRVAGVIDYETRPLHHLQVIATDNAATPMATARVFPVTVTNLIESNEEAVRLSLTGIGARFAGHGNPALVHFNADPDGDGLPNALEILLGTDPSSPDAHPPVAISTTVEDGKTYLVYEFLVADGSGLRFRCSGSGDLNRWEPLSQLPVLAATERGLHRYRVRDDIALEDTASRFMRLEVDPSE